MVTQLLIEGRSANMWDDIHPSIRTSSQSIAEAGKFDDAIFAAFRYVEAEIQERIRSSSIGQALLDEAFDGAAPKVIISDDARDRAGIKAIVSGALANIRNDRGHKKAPLLPCTSPADCLLYLSFASFLLYLLSKDKNTFPQIQALRVLGSYDQPRVELRGINFGKAASVIANDAEVIVVRTTETVVEALLPPGFSGLIKIAVDGIESNELYYDAVSLRQDIGNTYEIVASELPLYEDPECDRLRSGVVGLLLCATEAGRAFLRITPTYPHRYQAGYYVSQGQFGAEELGETWYRDPNSGEVFYAWTGSTIATPEIIGPVGTPVLVGISILPNKVKLQDDERRTLRVLGITKDGAIRKEIDVTGLVSWRPLEADIAYVKEGIVFPKRLGRTRVECALQAFVASADVWVEHYPRSEKVTFFEGVRRLQQIKVDQEDNLYFCNQSASVFRIGRAGGLQEVVRLSLPETAAYGIDCIAIDSNRNLYVSDIEKRVCLRFPWTGTNYATPEIIASIVPGPKKGIVVDSTGNIFVAVMGPGIRDGRIVHVKPNGTETFFPTRDMAIYLALDSAGNILTPSRNERAIHVYNRSGELINSIVHDVADAESDILADQTGAIYLPFFHSGKLLKITEEEGGIRSELIAEGFQNPGGIARDSRGRLYVSNFGGNTIEMIY
jgi:Protein of unknown function (Hypoth_ymh)